MKTHLYSMQELIFAGRGSTSHAQLQQQNTMTRQAWTRSGNALKKTSIPASIQQAPKNSNNAVRQAPHQKKTSLSSASNTLISKSVRHHNESNERDKERENIFVVVVGSTGNKVSVNSVQQVLPTKRPSYLTQHDNNRIDHRTTLLPHTSRTLTSMATANTSATVTSKSTALQIQNLSSAAQQNNVKNSKIFFAHYDGFLGAASRGVVGLAKENGNSSSSNINPSQSEVVELKSLVKKNLQDQSNKKETSLDKSRAAQRHQRHHSAAFAHALAVKAHQSAQESNPLHIQNIVSKDKENMPENILPPSYHLQEVPLQDILQHKRTRSRDFYVQENLTTSRTNRGFVTNTDLSFASTGGGCRPSTASLTSSILIQDENDQQSFQQSLLGGSKLSTRNQKNTSRNHYLTVSNENSYTKDHQKQVSNDEKINVPTQNDFKQIASNHRSVSPLKNTTQTATLLTEKPSQASTNTHKRCKSMNAPTTCTINLATNPATIQQQIGHRKTNSNTGKINTQLGSSPHYQSPKPASRREYLEQRSEDKAYENFNFKNSEEEQEISVLECKEVLEELEQSDKKEVNDEALIKQFEQQLYSSQQRYNTEQEVVNHLKQSEYIYLPDTFYIDRQREIKWLMRAILIDWMIEVSNEFMLKRETLYIAVNYVDRFLTALADLPKARLQLVGVTALHISCKSEEIYPPHLDDFVRSCDNGYSREHIKDTELEILKTLKFRMNPPTLVHWAQILMAQWDTIVLDLSTKNSQKNQRESFGDEFQTNYRAFSLFTEECEDTELDILQIQRNGVPLRFKFADEQSYHLFREVMQILDVCLLEVQTLQYQQRMLVAATIFLVLGRHLNIFTLREIQKNMESVRQTLLVANKFSIFQYFFRQTFELDVDHLLPYVQYVSTFFHLKLNFELPTAAKLNREQVLQGHFEDFLAFQTHNSDNLECVKQRQRQY